MIPFDFEYYRPATLDEAVQLFGDLEQQNKKPVYYAGGTEIISMARMNHISTKAVIDIKDIPECNVLGMQDNTAAIGAAVTLNKICEANIFPMLTKVARSSADHTSRNRITIGGNICGKVPYREGILSFLVCESKVVIMGQNGMRTVNIYDIFNENLRLEKGELLVQILTDKEYLGLPFEAAKKTKQERIDYPLLSIAAVKKDNQIRAAFSGLCAFPFRSKEIEAILNNRSQDEKLIYKLVSRLPGPILSNILGSREYREFVLENILSDIIEKLGAR